MKFGKPIIPTEEMRSILKLCIEWYSSNPCGGKLHVILDDDNVGDYLINYGYDYLKGDPNEKLGISILDGLKKLTISQREWVTMNIYNVKDGEGEREILEELEDDYE